MNESTRPNRAMRRAAAAGKATGEMHRAIVRCVGRLDSNEREAFSEASKEMEPEFSNEEVKEDIKAIMREERMAMLRENVKVVTRTPEMMQALRALTKEAVAEVAREMLAESLPSLEQEMRKVIAEKWRGAVEAEASAILDDALAKLRAKFT